MIPIKKIPINERPREKLLQQGANSLSSVELLAILLGSGTRNCSALELANEILSRTSQGLHELDEFTAIQWQSIPGIGPSKAAVLMASMELHRRIQGQQAKRQDYIKSPQAAYHYMKSNMQHLKREIFVVLHLNTKNKVIDEDIVSMGTLNASIVHPREVFQNAIKNSASSILVLHNHPSGDLSPSQEDISLTHRLRECGEILGIPLTDHVIVARTGYLSMKSEGLL